MSYTTARRTGRAEWTKLRTLPSAWRTAVIRHTAGAAATRVARLLRRLMSR